MGDAEFRRAIQASDQDPIPRDRAVVRMVFAGDGLARLDALEPADLLRSLAQHFSLVPDALDSEYLCRFTFFDASRINT